MWTKTTPLRMLISDLFARDVELSARLLSFESFCWNLYVKPMVEFLWVSVDRFDRSPWYVLPGRRGVRVPKPHESCPNALHQVIKVA